MLILGINAAYHEPAAALLVDGNLSFFVEEERINRVKHGKPSRLDNADVLPEAAIRMCLSSVGATLDDVDLIGFSFDGTGRRRNIGVDRYADAGGWGTTDGENSFHDSLMRVPARLESLGRRPLGGRFRWVPHHVAHAASAFLASPYDRALVLAVDGIAEFDTMLVALGEETRIRPLMTLPYPHSLGFLWEKLAQFLGFSEYDACKVMGLASYGDPAHFRVAFERLARLHRDGTFHVDGELVRFRSASMEGLAELFGPARQKGEPIEDRHRDVAAILQEFTEQAIVTIGRVARERTGADAVAIAGGVALNCVANARLELDAGFSSVFVQPAANDAGTALGAALHLWTNDAGGERRFVLDHAYWGPEYHRTEVKTTLERRGFAYDEVEDPAEAAAQMVSEGALVGWFQGRMEIGPRALGNRSLLADPRRGDMRDTLNTKIKHREVFRPFAPSILAERAAEWFELPGRSLSTDYMLFAYPAKPGKREQIPAVVHVDGTSRIQTVRRQTNPLYHALITAFERRTGVPLVLNTSFNDSEPIVMSPDDALNTFAKTGIDAVVIGPFVVRKSARA